ADVDLRGKWVLRGQPALVDSTSPRWGEKASYYSAVCLETGEVEVMELAGKQLRCHLGNLPAATAGTASRVADRHLGQRPGAWGSSAACVLEHAGPAAPPGPPAGLQPGLQPG